MEDVLDVYQRPLDPKRPLICLDETGKELQETPRGQMPLAPGQAIREDYEYMRHGACNMFLAIAPLLGWRHVRVTDRHTGAELAEYLRQLVEEDFPDADALVLVTDNLNIHTPACLYQRFAPEQARRIAAKLEWHHTPEHASWMNIAECELSVLARQCLDRRIPNRATLEQALAAWETKRNKAHTKVTWQFTTADARIKLKRLYPIIT
jgi:hypothetical protein